MVHKKYVKKERKPFGPYLYETRRVDGKVVTTYVGKAQEKRARFLPYYLVYILLLMFLVLYLVVSGQIAKLSPVDESFFEASEEITGYGKRIVISSLDDLVSRKISVSTEILESWKISDSTYVKVYWVEQERFVDFEAIDLDGNGKIDLVIFEVDIVGGEIQTFDIILIAKAEHLDENRNFISNIFEEVKELDEVWSESIPDGDYVRVVFEIPLTSDRDITVYPRVVSGEPRIEVYEIDGNELIAEFESLNDNEYNTIFLDNLQGTQDTFDLRIVSGWIEFDHIIDPPQTRLVDTAFAFVASSIEVGGQTTVQGIYDVVNANNWDGTFQVRARGPGGGNPVTDICQAGVPIRTVGCSETLASCSCNVDNTVTCVGQATVTGASVTWTVEGCEVSGPVSYLTFKVSGDATQFNDRDPLTVTAPQVSIAVTLSPSLTAGIDWTVSQLPVVEQDAVGNNGVGSTDYFVDVDANVDIDLYVRADTDLTSGGDMIPIVNEKYSFDVSDDTVPTATKTSLDTNYILITTLPSGQNTVYLKFFLDVSGGQLPGSYTNTLTFTAVDAGGPPPI